MEDNLLQGTDRQWLVTYMYDTRDPRDLEERGKPVKPRKESRCYFADSAAEAEKLSEEYEKVGWDDWLVHYSHVSTEEMDTSLPTTEDFPSLNQGQLNEIVAYYRLATVDQNKGTTVRKFVEQFLTQSPEEKAANLAWAKFRGTEKMVSSMLIYTSDNYRADYKRLRKEFKVDELQKECVEKWEIFKASK